MTKSKGILPPRRHWSEADLELLRRNYANSRADDLAKALQRPLTAVYAKAKALGLAKSAAFLSSVRSGRIQRGQDSPTRFKKGLVPWNKGMRGLQLEGSKATQFKPGNRTGKAAVNWVPIGTYRISPEGYLQVKVRDAGTGVKNFEPVHRRVWIAAHGPVPPGHIVAFKPGRSTTVLERITLDALECISRAENIKRNHWRTRHPELAGLVQLKGAITRQVNRIAREAQEQQP